MKLTIVIPALNEERVIESLGGSLEGIGEAEVILADGGSTDRSVEMALGRGWGVVAARRGRGNQMNAGARAASGDTLLFLHADTRLPANGLESIRGVMSDPGIAGGNFSLCFDGESREARWLTRLYPLLRLGGMCYGDSGFFIRREIFDSIGGFRDYPIFEDCDLFRRVRRSGRFVTLEAVAITSSRRFEGRFFRTFALWALLQILYWAGVSPSLLGRLYYRPRATKSLSQIL